MKPNLLAWNFSCPTLEFFGGQLSTRSISDLPFSLSTIHGSDVSANPGFDFFAMPMPQAGSSKIVFTSNRDGNAEIYSMNADGSGLTRLTANDFNDDHPRWSPDGTKILFQSDRDNPVTGTADVYVMNANGTGQTRLTYDAADDSAAAWSPDGTKIVFQSLRNGQYYQVYVMNADGTNQLNKSNGIAADYQPSWSPDGSKIAFASERDHAGRPSVYVMNANGTNQTRLTFSSDPFRDEQPAWSRDATRIAFVSTRDSVIETWQETDDEGGILNRSRVLTNKEVYKMNADGSNQIRLTNTLENDDSPSWSPDGTQIIFRSEREREAYDPSQQLWTMNADGTSQTLINSNEFGDSSPSWNSGTANQSPIAAPGGPYSGVVAQNVPFDGSAAFDPDGTIASYSWSFGDGGAGGTGAAPTHTYTSTGSYTVMLTVTDNQGAQATANTTITITAAGSEQYLANFNQSALARPQSPEESTYWNDITRAAFANGQGSMLLAMREMGKTIVESSEYAARGRTNHWYVYDLYKTYMMREPDAPGWAFWEGVCNSYGRENVRRAFDESSEFAGIVATFTPTGSSSNTVTSFASAQVDPFNQPGNGLTSRDTGWSVPLLSLPGRAGLDLGLSLSYSSMVWTRSGPYIYFDEDNGWPSPGFRLGFPTIQEKMFNAQVGDNVYLLIAGSRVSLRQVGTSNVYAAADSSYLQLIDNGGSLLVRATDGTQLSYLKFNNEWHCTQIKDLNGNFLTVNYDWLGHITTITDTLARTITFNYDTNANLLSITQSRTVNGSPQTHTSASFGWTTKTLSPSFSGVSVVGAPTGSIPVLSQVGLDDGSRHTFEYNATGQVNPIRSYGSDNVERTYTAYGYDYPAGDCPRLAETHVWAQSWTGINGVPQVVATVYGDPGDGSHTMTAPDGTLYKEFYGSGWQRGLTTQTEVWSAGVKQKWTSNNWTQDNTALNYQTNPRVTETNVHDPSNHRRTTIDYQSFTLPSGASCSLPSDTREYAGSASTALRHSHIAYRMDAVDDVAYLSRHLIGLVKEQSLFQVSTSGETLMSKVGFEYDETGSIQGADMPVQHDNSYDGNFVTGRGNLTSMKRYDVSVIDNSQFTRSRMEYNTAGAVVSSKDPRNHETKISYTDSFAEKGSDLDAPRSFATLAFPTTVTDADNHSSLVRYNYDTGAKTRVQGPPPANQTQGLIQIFAYDAAIRIERVTTTNNGAYQRFVYGPNYVQTFATVNSVADEAYSNTIFDGLGRTTGVARNHPSSMSGYKAQLTQYDLMGRAVKQSNPAEIDSGWNPAGDDAAGWLYSQQMYDWQGRPLVTTNTDGTTKEASYSGCGCAGGQVVVTRDEIGRRQKIGYDILGRLRSTQVLFEQPKSQVLNGDGTVYSTTVNTYNARDQVTHVRQYQGNENSGVYQTTAMSYDGYARLETKHVPAQQVDPANGASTDHTTWVYNADDTIQRIIDARGVITIFDYNNRHQPTEIVYDSSNVPASANVSFAPPITYAYDPAGNRTSMSDGVGSMTYQYNQLSRMTSETRSFNGLTGTYTLTYGYNLAGHLTSLAEPSQYGATVSYGHDTSGRLSNVTGSGLQTSQLMTDVEYRASGSLKHASFGDGAQLNLSYDQRLRPTRHELDNVLYAESYPPVITTMGTENQYYADGSVRYARDLQNGNFDRAYSYDHIGRLQEGTSGREARGEALANPVDNPYRQNYSYDVWGNQGRTARLWSEGQTDVPNYSNNRRVDWVYDAAGNVTMSGTGKDHAYDAAGNKVSYYEEEWSGPAGDQVLHQNTIVQTYDGGGQPSKRVETRRTEDMNATVNTEVKTAYYVRSSVLGGASIAEIDESLQREGHVYVGGEKLADYNGWAPYGWMSIRHVNPTTGNWIDGQVGGAGTRTEVDPLGAVVGITNPYISNSSYSDLMANNFLYNELGNPFNLGSGCKLDGMPISCSELNERMESGLVESEYPGRRMRDPNQPWNTHERNRFVTLRKKIKSYGLGYFEIWMPGEFRHEFSQGGYVGVLVAPQRPAPTGDCAKFADLVEAIANATIGKHNDTPGKDVQMFMDKLATTFTEFPAARFFAVVGAGTPVETANTGAQRFGSSGFASAYFEPDWVEPNGRRVPMNQVRHAVGGLLAGYVRITLGRMNGREDPNDRDHGVPDINLNGQTVPMGNRIADNGIQPLFGPKRTGPFGRDAVRGLANWIRDTLCAR